MSLIDTKSIPSTKSELDLFTVPPTQVVVKRGFWHEIQPLNSVTNEGPYEFTIPPDPHYTQLNKNFIYMQLRIKKPVLPAGTASTPDLAPINLIGKTLFKQVKCFLNGKLISDSSDKYAYRAFLETELNFGYDAKQSHLQSALYFKESGENVDAATNESFKTRSALFKDEKIVEVIAPLHIDLFLQDRYLINYIDMRLELYRNTNAFVMQCFNANITNLELEVRQMKLLIRKVELLDSVNLAIENTLTNYAAKYPVRRVVMTNLHVAHPSRSTPHHTLFSGQLPRRIIFACVDATAYRGTYGKSPFNFQPFGINGVKVICGGQTYPASPLKIDFTKDRFIQAYSHLYEALDLAHENKGNLINMTDYKTSHSFFGFDLTPDEDDSGHWDLIREGSTSIEVEFGKDLPQSGIEIVIYAEFDNLIMIDKHRNTFYDYNA